MASIAGSKGGIHLKGNPIKLKDHSTNQKGGS